MCTTPAKFKNDRNKAVREVAFTLNSLNASEIPKNEQVHNLEKDNVMIMFKSHAHFKTMRKTSAKFQKDRNITVRGFQWRIQMGFRGFARTPSPPPF